MKGISPLLASVFLIAATVIIAVVVMNWTTLITRNTQATVSNRTEQAVDCSAASITIDAVYVRAGANLTSTALVRNSGQSNDMIIQSAQLLNITGGNFSASGLPITGFNKGTIAALTFPNAFVATCPGNFSQLIVTTTCGGITDTFKGVPNCL